MSSERGDYLEQEILPVRGVRSPFGRSPVSSVHRRTPHLSDHRSFLPYGSVISHAMTVRACTNYDNKCKGNSMAPKLYDPKTYAKTRW
jgi:hypothetical protein